MPLRTNIKNLGDAAKILAKDIIAKPVSMAKGAAAKIKRNPKKSAAVAAGLAGSTGFYLYDGKRNAYEDEVI